MKIQINISFSKPNIKLSPVSNSPELSKMMDLRHTNSSPWRFIIRNRDDVASNMSKISTMPSTHFPWFLWKHRKKSIKREASGRHDEVYIHKNLLDPNLYQKPVAILFEKYEHSFEFQMARPKDVPSINHFHFNFLQEVCCSIPKSAVLIINFFNPWVIKHD